ncbi:hypothetical protein MA16_Dca026110 [Dendrobium catenatum]|uniref:Uncharacterized protein n=1 Tax=Dendrobium catenatum TaxID=906689 RepID=A0A2I0W4C5_9ASPA|nr:hypothetical protein MA16_Dca026110 [Dendrobium catenatum]
MRGMTGSIKDQISFSSQQNLLSQISKMERDGISSDHRSPCRISMAIASSQATLFLLGRIPYYLIVSLVPRGQELSLA